MRPLLSTFFLMVIAALATWYWTPAAFGFVFIVPLALLSLGNLPSERISSGTLSARTVFILTAALGADLVYPPAR